MLYTYLKDLRNRIALEPVSKKAVAMTSHLRSRKRRNLIDRVTLDYRGPVIPIGSSKFTAVDGLFLYGDITPTASSLASKPELINGSFATCTDFLGYYEAMGADLGSAQTVSIIKLFMNSYFDNPTSWWSDAFGYMAIYSSSDNSSWTLRQEYNPGPFAADSGTLFHTTLTLNTPVSARYWKVVVSSAGVATAPNYDNSYGAEIELYS
jgi:hypothetical protein